MCSFSSGCYNFDCAQPTATGSSRDMGNNPAWREYRGGRLMLGGNHGTHGKRRPRAGLAFVTRHATPAPPAIRRRWIKAFWVADVGINTFRIPPVSRRPSSDLTVLAITPARRKKSMMDSTSMELFDDSLDHDSLAGGRTHRYEGFVEGFRTVFPMPLVLSCPGRATGGIADGTWPSPSACLLPGRSGRPDCPSHQARAAPSLS